MFNLKQILDETNIDYQYFTDAIGISIEDLYRAFELNDNQYNNDLYNKFIVYENDKHLKPELYDFYRDYINDENELNSFISIGLKNVNSRRMINMLKRHVLISNYMSKYDSECDILVLFNLIVAIEAVFRLSGNNGGKCQRLILFFNNDIKNEDKVLIQNNFKLDHCDPILKPQMDTSISMDDFARILYALRCNYVHDGDFWAFKFNFDYSNYWLMTSMNVSINGEQKSERKFITLLTLAQLKEIITLGLINHIKKYISNLSPEELTILYD